MIFLTHYFKSKSNLITCNNFNCPIGLKRQITDGHIVLEKAKQNQEKCKSNLNELKRGKPEHKSKK